MSLFYTFFHFAQRHTVDASYIEELNVLLHVTSQLLSEWAALAPREDWWRWRVGGEVLGVNSYKQCVSVVQIWGKIDEFYRAELKLVLLVVLKMAVASRLTLCGNCSYSQTQGTPRASLLYCHSSGFLLLNCFTPPVPVLRLLTPALCFFFSFSLFVRSLSCLFSLSAFSACLIGPYAASSLSVLFLHICSCCHQDTWHRHGAAWSHMRSILRVLWVYTFPRLVVSTKESSSQLIQSKISRRCANLTNEVIVAVLMHPVWKELQI